MARPKNATAKGSFDQKRARIAELVATHAPTAAHELRELLADRNGFIVGDAAAAVKTLEIRELARELESALGRLLGEPPAADKGCHGKRRLLEAILALELDARDVVRKSLHFVQMEPAFPKAEDTAASIRALAAHALVDSGAPTALAEITPLLVDPSPIVRTEVALAVGRTGVEGAGPVLHLKALVGDSETDVLQSVLSALLRVDPSRYLREVAKLLEEADSAKADAAALALGESRLAEALPVLLDAETRATGQAVRSLLTAIALLRSDAGNAHLVELIASGPEGRALEALEALSLHRHDEKLAGKVAAAVKERGSKRLDDVLRELFGSPT